MRKFNITFVVFLLLSVTVENLYAQQFEVSRPIEHSNGCLRSLGETTTPMPIIIPVGCDAVGCCPECQDGLIDWKIRATGIGGRDLTIKFENLDPNRAKRLVTKGYGNWVSPDTLKLEDGETIIRGIGDSGQQVVPVATPNFALDQKSIKLLERAIAEKQRAKVEPVNIHVEIDQMRGPVIVSSQVLKLTHSDCMKLELPPRFTTEVVDLINNRGSDEAGVWIRAAVEAGKCLIDYPVCVTNERSLPNFKFSCSGNYFAFSEDDGMVWRLKQWHETDDDVLSIRFPDMVDVPLQVWLIAADADRLEKAQMEVAIASMIYNKQHCGVRFSPTYVDLSNQPEAEEIESSPSNNSIRTCSKLKSNIGFQSGAINVYYLTNTALGAPYQCNETGNPIGTSGEPMVVIGGTKTPESLSHEIGHAFSLAHACNSLTTNCNYPPSEGAESLTCSNVMATQGACSFANGPRSTFTEGQCFRMNADKISWINKLGLRQGSTKDCWLGEASNAVSVVPTNPFCPPISANIDHPLTPALIQQLPPDFGNLCGPGKPLEAVE